MVSPVRFWPSAPFPSSLWPWGRTERRSTGGLLPLPADGEDPTIGELRTDVRTLRGRVAFVESVRTMHSGAMGSAPQDGWKPSSGAAPRNYDRLAGHGQAWRDTAQHGTAWLGLAW